jgi:hypothetical protein
MRRVSKFVLRMRVCKKIAINAYDFWFRTKMGCTARFNVRKSLPTWSPVNSFKTTAHAQFGISSLNAVCCHYAISFIIITPQL